MYDAAAKPAAPPSIYMIDFARCRQTKHDLTHTLAWVPGNREDGFLFGLDNLIELFEHVSLEAGEVWEAEERGEAEEKEDVGEAGEAGEAGEVGRR